MALTINAFDNADALTRAFADTLIELLKDGIAQRGRASLVVSGGRTPLAPVSYTHLTLPTNREV